MSAHCRGGSRTARARTLTFFVSNWVSPYRTYPADKKTRVRATPSGTFVGLKNICSPRQYGVKGPQVPCGAWGSAPKTPRRRSPIQTRCKTIPRHSRKGLSDAITPHPTIHYSAFHKNRLHCDARHGGTFSLTCPDLRPRQDHSRRNHPTHGQKSRL